MEIVVRSPGWLRWRGTDRLCTIGRGGIRTDKCEGDGATPAGLFALRRLLYRADRLQRPRTGLPIQAVAAHDGWCDHPDDPQYNRQVSLPYPARCERLWRSDNLYDLIVVLGHNDSPIVPGEGSAIFLHVAASDYRPTEGCIAVAHDALLMLLVEANTSWVMRIEADS